MSTTYIEAVNKLLAFTNEVELSYLTFAAAIGVHKVAKDAVNDAYMQICGEATEWPWLSSANSNINEPQAGNVVVETQEGVRWYLLKEDSENIREDFSKVDWDSFYLTNKGVEGAVEPFKNYNLKYYNFDDWNTKFRTVEDSGTDDEPGYNTPIRVTQSQDGRYFGVSPIPDGVYKIYFTAWERLSKLSLYNHPILIPDDYIYVLDENAKARMHLFKKEFQEATLAEQKYNRGLDKMRNHLIARPSEYMRSDWKRR